MSGDNQIVSVVRDLITKAQGYVSHGKVSGKEAEAVDHGVPTDAPKADEKKKETNKANSGTHPEKGGAAGSSDRHEGGDDFKDGSEDTIGGEGKASPGRPGTIKHEATTAGPDHPGTATGKQQQQKSEEPGDLKKSDDDRDRDEDDDKKDEEESEKSSESGEVYLDIDEFANEIVSKAVDLLDERYSGLMEKSHESDFVSAGLAKSLDATIDRLEEVEKAISNIATALNVRKSLMRSADNIKGVKNASLEGSSLSKGEISAKLLDLQMGGDPNVDVNTVLKYDATGDLSVLSPIVKSKLGLE